MLRRTSPAPALESAVLARMSELGSQQPSREKIVERALKMLDVDSEQVDLDMATARHRLARSTHRFRIWWGCSKRSGTRD